MNWENRIFQQICLGCSIGSWLLIGISPTSAQAVLPQKGLAAEAPAPSAAPENSKLSEQNPSAERPTTIDNPSPEVINPIETSPTKNTLPEAEPPSSNGDKPAKTTPAKPITVVNAVPGEVIRLPRPAAIDPQTIAVFLGRTDITSQVEISETEILYQPKLLSVSPGNQTVIVYQINSPQDWQEIKRFTVKLGAIANQPNEDKSTTDEPDKIAEKSSETPEGEIPQETPEASEQPEASEPGDASEAAEANEDTPSTRASDLTITPTLNINVKSQFSEFRSPDAGVSERPVFNDATFTGGLEANYEKGSFKIGTKFNLLGVTFQPEALRFGELQQGAPQLDLNEYLINLAAGPASLDVGHVCYGNHPLLVTNVCTRGLTAKVKFNDVVDFSLGRISSTAIVGFDNIVGLERDENALTSATLGLQILKNSNGGVRLETSWMQGQRSPISNFNVGEVVDSEKSDGFGLRLTATDESGRLKGDAGFARSTFANPSQNDPELAAGLGVVEVVPVTKNAWYTEASYDIIQGLKLDENREISLSANFRRERIDPQFGSLGASVTADALQTTYGFNAAIAGASLQFQENAAEDNLANVVNILKTRSRNKSLNITAPLQEILQVQSPFLPTFTYGWQQSKQKGSIIAALDGGFNDESQIPDQNNVTQQAGVSWNIDNLTLSYQYSNALQDNRQFGRENADFRNISNQFEIGLQASPTMNFSIGYGITQVEDLEQAVTRFSHAPTFGFNWEFVKNLTFALNFNRNDDTDSNNEASARSEGIEMLLTWKFNVNALGRELPGSFFIRYGRQTSLSKNVLFDEKTDSTIHTVNGGFSFSF